jgi:hypothetical protein
MKIQGKLIRQILIFIPVVAGMSLVFDYPQTLLKPPQSVHNWRQCDGNSLALNYYKNGMHFFQPETHMLYSDDYTTGYAAPSETPILYYFVAVLYKIFGYHEYLFRGLNLLIFFIGLFYLFRLADEVLDNHLYSIIVTALVFSSPVLIYYANNFLPNTAALSFSFIAWFYFYRYTRDHQTRTFLLSMLFFTVAGSLKITELTGPVIILILMVADHQGWANLHLKTKENRMVKLAALAGVFIAIAGWVFYAKYYNTVHNSVQFQTYTTAIWSISREDIALVLHNMKVLWYRDYFYPPTLWFMVLCLLLIPVFWKRADHLLKRVSLMLAGALIAFSLLWFHQLGDHDYFYTGFYVLPAFVFINFFTVLKGNNFNRVADWTVKIIFIGVVIMNVYYGKQRHSLRYTSWMNDFPQTKDLYTIDADEAGIGENERIIFYPSRYIRPLYLMDRQGWVIQEHNEVNAQIEKRDSTLMQTFHANGARYFITNDIESAAQYKPFAPYMKVLFRKFNSIYIFKIPPLNENFTPQR